MTPTLPPAASFADLVGTVVRIASRQVAEGSRRNARDELDRRAEQARDDGFVLAALSRRGVLPRPRRTA
jgi:hypothetical protein